MNSDPHESAAWRAFGMLDAEESAAFDDALRENADLRDAYREINALTAAVAAAQVKPLQTRAGDFERLQTRLGLRHKRPVNLLGISGWAIAASLALLLVVSHRPRVEAGGNTAQAPTGASGTTESATDAPAENHTERIPVMSENPLAASATSAATTDETEANTPRKVETMRLIQEISVLREKLEKVAKRDERRFEIVPGRSWPVMMTMAPPQESEEDDETQEEAPALTSRVADALAGISSISGDPSASFAPDESAAASGTAIPAAIPIYDPVTDEGAIVVAGLPQPEEDMGNFLWVATETSDVPVLVGQLPPNESQQAVSIDFELGTKGILPTSFILTKGDIGSPAAPSAKNTILIGPR
jgi:hypothetical protein